MTRDPRLLILETSDQPGQVAVAEGSVVKGHRRLDEARRHARDLAPAVADLLTEQGWKARDLHAVLVSIGPGSYTGLRVGLISAKSLAYATGCALIGVETFHAIAQQAPAEVADLEILADAQQDRVYCQRYRRETIATALVPISPLKFRNVADWLADRDRDAWIAGPWLRQHLSRLPPQCRLLPETCRHPKIDSLVQIGLARWRRGDRDDLWTIEPLYLRPSSAEEKWATRPLPAP